MNKQNYIVFSAYAGILAAVTDIVSTVAFGYRFPGYNWLNDTVSKLGSSVSPVSNQISALWIAIGILLILYGFGIGIAFSNKGQSAKAASWLIILYGLGEGIGSGLFKADHIANSLSTSGIIHEIFGSVGVISILLFPLVMLKVIPKNEKPSFYLLSKLIFATNVFFILLFLFRYSTDNTSIIFQYKGLWQRLFILFSYIYLIRVAVLLIYRRKQTESLS